MLKASTPSLVLLALLLLLSGPRFVVRCDDTISMNTAYTGFDKDGMAEVANRNLRDKELTDIERVIPRLKERIETVETTFDSNMSRLKEKINAIFPKDDYLMHLSTKNEGGNGTLL